MGLHFLFWLDLLRQDETGFPVTGASVRALEGLAGAEIPRVRCCGL